MLIFSMSVSADGFISDRRGGIDWTGPTDELFAVHLERVRGLSAHLTGRRLYETMRVWETDPSLRSSPAFTEFAEIWTALPKVVFSRAPVDTIGNARAAAAPLADEIAAALAGGGDVEIGGADLAGQAFRLGLVDEVQLFRVPVVLGGGTPFFPELPAPRELELRETRRFDPGVVLERYAVRTGRP
jgi:dihydrofolate reductase